MIENTLGKIEEKIQTVSSIPEGNKAELLQLLATLKQEIQVLSETEAERAESITGFAQVSTHEAIRQERNPQLLELSLQGLASSVQGFETSHPRLVEIVNAICQTLANIGI
jgi:queuine/archaeosine tRNA-ribosyltransferase